jgi:hypothetical protein
VEACKDEHIVVDNAIDEAVWKPAEDCSALVAMNHRKGKGILRQAVDESLHGREELIAQPRSLTLVPPVRLVNLSRKGRKRTRLKGT